MAVVSQDAKVRAEQIRLLYEAIPASVFSTVFIASIIGVILWSSSIPRTSLIVWLTLPFVISVARLIFYTQYTKDIDSGSDKVAIYERKFIVGTVLSAMVWGLLPISVYPDNITFQVVIAFALAGMSAGAVTSLSFHLAAIRIFLIVSLVPLIVRFLVSEDFVLQSMGVMVVAYLAMLLISAQRIYINTQQNIVLRLNSDRREHELEKIIAERERLDEMKNDFISTVSHELRTRVSSIGSSFASYKNDVV